MSALWHDSGYPSFLGFGPSFSFYEQPIIYQIAEIVVPAYTAARVEMQEREELLGAVWFLHNAALAHEFWERKKPWWVSL